MTLRHVPYAAFAAQAAVHLKYPIGRAKINNPQGGLRLFHHLGHAKGLLYWWERAVRKTPGPRPFPTLTRYPTMMVIDEIVPKGIEARIRAYYMRPPNPKKNCLFVKQADGSHVIVTDAIECEWVYP